MPAQSQQSSEARKSASEQRNRGGLWHHRREFSDSHLSIAGPEIGDQDLIGARVKGAAATSGPGTALETLGVLTERVSIRSAHTNDRLRHGLEPVCGEMVNCFIQCALITTRRMKDSHPAHYTDELGVLFDDMIRWAVCIVID